MKLASPWNDLPGWRRRKARESPRPIYQGRAHGPSIKETAPHAHTRTGSASHALAANESGPAGRRNTLGEILPEATQQTTLLQLGAFRELGRCRIRKPSARGSKRSTLSFSLSHSLWRHSPFQCSPHTALPFLT